ncbi:hypothetical protein Taro_023676 [Colocasia esculenta]|uniref:Uncharacterized protein n=1 Tax=Colocasia esculenta TaxID=4460 RepID=A0A843UY29_COLES|nr:hypothetical protein [Colocasia esculenta]
MSSPFARHRPKTPDEVVPQPPSCTSRPAVRPTGLLPLHLVLRTLRTLLTTDTQRRCHLHCGDVLPPPRHHRDTSLYWTSISRTSLPSRCEGSMNQLLSFSSSYPWSAMNEAGPSHNVNENFELHDAPVMNDEVLENSESDGDDDNDNIQSLSDDDVNDDTDVHMPERVWRQFGAPQVIPPAPERYDRKDGRGHARENWLLYHATNIQRWSDHANTIMEPPIQEEDQSQWRQWYGQQSNLYLTPFSEEPPTEYCPRGPIERALVDVTFCTRELLITNLEASYLDVKNEILKLQEDTLSKLRIKLSEYEQPSIPSGAEYTPGESSGGPKTLAHPWTSEPWPNVYDAQSCGISQMDVQMGQWTQHSGVLDALTPVRVPTPPPYILGGVHIHDEGTQLTLHIEEEDEGNDETERRLIRGRGKRVLTKKKR